MTKSMVMHFLNTSLVTHFYKLINDETRIITHDDMWLKCVSRDVERVNKMNRSTIRNGQFTSKLEAEQLYNAV